MGPKVDVDQRSPWDRIACQELTYGGDLWSSSWHAIYPVPRHLVPHSPSWEPMVPSIVQIILCQGFNLQHRMGRWSQEGSVRHVGGSLLGSHLLGPHARHFIRNLFVGRACVTPRVRCRPMVDPKSRNPHVPDLTSMPGYAWGFL